MPAARTILPPAPTSAYAVANEHGAADVHAGPAPPDGDAYSVDDAPAGAIGLTTKTTSAAAVIKTARVRAFIGLPTLTFACRTAATSPIFGVPNGDRIC